MKVEMQYRPETKTADIVNARTGEILKPNVRLSDVPAELSKIRSQVAQAARQAKVVK